MVPVKKPPPGSLSVNTVGTPPTGSAATAGSTPNIFAAATATPKSMINTTGEQKNKSQKMSLLLLLYVNSNMNLSDSLSAPCLVIRSQKDSPSMTEMFV